MRNLTNGSGQTVGAYSYRPFGEPAFASGTSSNRFRYTGQMSDPEAGLYYLRARYFEPSTGRFLTRDTIAPNPLKSQAWNMYAYVLNSPLNYADPTGHDIIMPRKEVRQFIINIGIGGWEAAVDEVTGIGDLLGAGWRSLTLDEQQWRSNRALADYVGTDPWGAGGAALEGILDPYRQAIDCGQHGKVVGRGTVEIVTTVVGFKGITKLGKLRRLGSLRRGLPSADELKLSRTVEAHLDDLVKHGQFKGEPARPFLNSRLLLQEIMDAQPPVPDPRGVSGALAWRVPGSFRGSSGVWELVVDPKTKTVLHFNFVSGR